MAEPLADRVIKRIGQAAELYHQHDKPVVHSPACLIFVCVWTAVK